MKITAKTITLALFFSIALMALWSQLNLLKAKNNYKEEINAPETYASKELDQGNVTVIVKPVSLAADQPPQFEVIFDTHTEELDFDVENTSRLTDDIGNEYGNANWNGTPSGGHHRKGILTFSKTLNSKVKSLTLAFSDIAGIPKREFTWEVRT